jgi:hypothetical protein
MAVLALACAGAILASCGMSDDDAECHPPCPLPSAIRLSVTAAGGGAVPGVVVTISGAARGTASCRPEATATICSVPGYRGVYDLEIQAPGFETQKRSVSVAGTMPDCGCPTTATADVELALTPIGSR